MSTGGYGEQASKVKIEGREDPPKRKRKPKRANPKVVLIKIANGKNYAKIHKNLKKQVKVRGIIETRNMEFLVKFGLAP